MIFVMMMVFLTTIIVVLSATFGLATVRNERQAEDQKIIQSAFDASVAKFDADGAAGTLTLPATRSISINGVTGNLTATDYSATITGTNIVTGTLAGPNGRQMALTGYFAQSHTVSPWDYELFANHDFAPAKSYTSGSVGTNGSVFVTGNITSKALTVINGNMSATGTIDSNATITGSKTQSATAPCNFPIIDPYDYISHATTSYATSQTINGLTFSTPSSGSPYDLIYCAQNLSIKGTISGVGTIYVAGNCDINGTITYANANSHLCIITPNDIALDKNCVGYYFCGSTCTISCSTLTGAVCAGTLTNSTNTGTYSFDNFVFNSSSTGSLMHMPGLWQNNSPATFIRNGPNITSITGGLQLIDGGTNEVDTAYVSSKQTISTFHTAFYIQFISATGSGATFCIQNQASTAVGAYAGDLGYGGITNSQAVKFDIYDTSGEGSDSTGLYANGVTPSTPAVDMTSSGVNMIAGNLLYVYLAYDGTTLTETITDTTTGTMFTTSYTANIASTIGSTTAWVGMTASDSNLIQNFQFTQFVFEP